MEATFFSRAWARSASSQKSGARVAASSFFNSRRLPSRSKMPPQRILAPYKLFNLFCGNHLYFVVCSLSFCRAGFEVSRPGLPREDQWRVGGCRQQWAQLGFYGYRAECGVLVFPSTRSLSELCQLPGSRSSVALPLGINGATTAFPQPQRPDNRHRHNHPRNQQPKKPDPQGEIKQSIL